MYWGVNEFIALYDNLNSLQQTNGNHVVNEPLFQKLVADLQKILSSSADEQKNQECRKNVESGKFSIDNEEYEVNKEFIVTVIQLSDELDCNELIVSQILLEIVATEESNSNIVTDISEASLFNKGKIAYYLRRQYILQILNFLVNTKSPLLEKLINGGNSSLIDNVIPSFKNIHQQLKNIQDMVNKYQILDEYGHFQQLNSSFRRNFLLKEYDLLSQILYGLVSTTSFIDKISNINKLIEFVTNDLQNNDTFILYYIPSLFKIPSALMKCGKNNESVVFQYFQQIIDDIEQNENLFLKPIKVLYYFTFLTYFISWCKEDPKIRIKQKKLDFESKLNKPMYQLVLAGAIEQLMIVSYETSSTSSGILKDFSLEEDEEGYDFKNLLQNHLPNLVPYQLMESSQMVYIGKPVKLSSELLNFFFIPTLHDFIQEFIANCAFLLTTLKDEEEDYTLSGSSNDQEVLLLDSIVKKADLERFFISVYYVYKNRDELNDIFWKDNQSTAYGFIEWSAKCSDTLMRSCFFIMLSGLASDSNKVFEYIADEKKQNEITWELLANILSQYIVKISNWELENNGIEKNINHLALKSTTTLHPPQQNIPQNSLNLPSQQRMQMQMPLQNQLQYQFNSNNQTHKSSTSFQSQLQRTRGSNSQQISDENQNLVTISDDLNEEVVAYLSSILLLIGSTAKNLKHESKVVFANTFVDIIFEFLKLNTSLLGAALTTLSTLIVPENHTKIWFKLDKFIFNNTTSSSSFASGYKPYFLNAFSNFNDVSGFLKLFEQLVSHESSGFVPFGYLQVPSKLGEGNRNHYGVGPYLEYIIDEVFKNSQSIIDPKRRHPLQSIILTIIKHCLKAFDFQVILDLNSSVGTNLDSLVPQNNFMEYIMESPSTLILSHLFDENVHRILFFIISVGFDKLSSEEKSDTESVICLDSLCIIDDILVLQETFIEEMVPIVKQQMRVNSRFYVPKSFGLHGQRTFYDAILFNLPMVAHISLYVGLENKKLASKSLSILDKVTTFGELKQIVLNIFNSVDESSRIKQSFIDQIDSEIESETDFAMKLQVLRYLKDNLKNLNKLSVSHFLLGFQVTPILSTGPSNLSTFVASDSSLLKSLVSLTIHSLKYISSQEISYSPIKLISECFQIILSLCKSDLTSDTTLNFLDSFDFFVAVLNNTPDVDSNTVWNGLKFSEFTSADISFASILEFFQFRKSVLEYFSLEIHRLRFTELGKHYVDLLTSTLILQSSKVFGFLDIIKNYSVLVHNINLSNMFDSLEIYKNGVVFNNVVNSLETVDVFTCVNPPSIYDFSALDSLLNLRKQWLEATNVSVDPSKDLSDRNYIKNQITQSQSEMLFNKLQLRCLHSWVQLVQVLVTDGGLVPAVRCSFIMEIFETIIPQINDLVDMNLEYSEELVSMTVFLYDLYDKDRSYDARSLSVDKKLYSLFKTCMHGIVSPLSTISMRSDLYVIANKFITKLFNPNEDQKLDADRITLAKEVLFELKMTSERLVETIASDAIGGEGPHRITGLILLDSLVQLAGMSKVNFVIAVLSRSNMLLLIIRSLKVIDEVLFTPTETTTSDNILYELTVFKTTMNFLVHVGETKHGAQELVQNEVLKILSSCSFARFDLNLGTDLLLNEHFDEHGVSHVELKIKLDDMSNKSSDLSTISLFELFVPIFQLLSAIVLSIGNENRMVLKSVNGVLIAYEKFMQGIIKRDALVESGDCEMSLESEKNLKELVKLIIVLCTLTGFDNSQL